VNGGCQPEARSTALAAALTVIVVSAASRLTPMSAIRPAQPAVTSTLSVCGGARVSGDAGVAGGRAAGGGGGRRSP